MDLTRFLRALTLVEVLAATILLALTAGVCLPMLQPLRQAATSGDSLDHSWLCDAAEAFMRDPGASGFESLPEADAFHFEYVYGDSAKPVEVERMRSEAQGVAHAWLAFRHGDTVIFRWERLPESSEAGP